MKTKYILLILTAWITASCSLQEDTEGFSTPGDFYKTPVMFFRRMYDAS